MARRNFREEKIRYYEKVKERGWTWLPVKGNVHVALAKLLQGETRGSQLAASMFTEWECEQLLVFGFAIHKLGEKEDYRITPLGVWALQKMDEAYKFGHTEHKVRVTCNVNDEWLAHFKIHSW